MLSKRLIAELKKLLKQRGEVTKDQREYAKVEEEAMMQIYTIPKPSEEKRFPHLRTLESYVGEYALKMIVEDREDIGVMQETL